MHSDEGTQMNIFFNSLNKIKWQKNNNKLKVHISKSYNRDYVSL